MFVSHNFPKHTRAHEKAGCSAVKLLPVTRDFAPHHRPRWQTFHRQTSGRMCGRCFSCRCVLRAWPGVCGGARAPARAAPADHAPWMCARSKHAWRVNAWPRGCSTTLLPVVSLATSRSWLQLRRSAFRATTAVKMQDTAFLAPTSRARACQRPVKGQKARPGPALQREIT